MDLSISTTYETLQLRYLNDLAFSNHLYDFNYYFSPFMCISSE
jgi:hypothetical protein